MPTTELLDALPLWAVYLVTVLVSLLAIELGYRLGQVRQQRLLEPKEGAVGAITAATLGLLAFLLAFIMGAVLTRFDDRHQLVIEEANAIGTTYLRAGYLAEPYRAEIRSLLRAYVDARLAASQSGQAGEALARSEQIHNKLWAVAEAIAGANPESEMAALCIVSLNQVIDLHTERFIVATTTRLPSAIWLGVYLVTFLAMLLIGFYSSYDGSRNIVALAGLVLVFSTVLLLIVDLDRPQEGILRVSQQALINLQQQLHPSP